MILGIQLTNSLFLEEDLSFYGEIAFFILLEIP